MRLRGPKVKIARALGIPLTPKAIRVMENRPNPPGQHGAAAASRRKISNYKRQLVEKQRLRAQYNVSEAQLRRAFAAAVRQGGNTGERLLILLERRLDAVVYRAGLARTIFAARQLVSHGHVRLDGKKVNTPAQLVSPGQRVSLSDKAREIPQVVLSLSTARPPAYLTLENDKGAVILREEPTADKIPVIVQAALIVEYFSR